jgi:glucosamine kinase
MPTFVGLDCGGSTSRVLAVDETGTAVFRGQSGPANLLATPEDIVERNLRKAAEGCPPATSVCGAFAGLVGPNERARALTLLRDIFPGAEVRAEADYYAAHAAAPVGTHVTVIAGTGSLVCGEDADGKLVKSGGRGYLLGDEGSGYRFGHAALVHFLRRPSGRTANLWAAVEETFGSREDATIVEAVYQAPSPQPLLARLLPAFAKDLDAGAAYAEAIAAREQADLAELVALHIETHLFDLPEVRIALAGGVWNATDRFERLFRQSLEGWLPDTRIEIDRIVRPPVQGAVALAKEQLIGNGE